MCGREEIGVSSMLRLMFRTVSLVKDVDDVHDFVLSEDVSVRTLTGSPPSGWLFPE